MAALIEAQIRKQFCRTDRDLRQLKRVEKWREHKGGARPPFISEWN